MTGENNTDDKESLESSNIEIQIYSLLKAHEMQSKTKKGSNKKSKAPKKNDKAPQMPDKISGTIRSDLTITNEKLDHSPRQAEFSLVTDAQDPLNAVYVSDSNDTTFTIEKPGDYPIQSELSPWADAQDQSNEMIVADSSTQTVTSETLSSTSKQPESSHVADSEEPLQSEQTRQPSPQKLESQVAIHHDSQPIASPVNSSAQNWYLVTNHLNMAHIVAAGMVMGPAGFGGKHYNDTLTIYPGQIPLFLNQVPKHALTEATKERKDLRPCIASISLEKLNGNALVLSWSGEWSIVKLPCPVQSDDIALFVRAPLPLEMISSIIFNSEDDQKYFEERAHCSSNVDLSLLPITIQETLFMNTRKVPWPPSTQSPVTVNDAPPARGQAVGSILAMLYHIANGSDLGTATFRFSCGENGTSYDAGIKDNSILAELSAWLETGKVRDNADIRARTFWGVVDALIEASLQGQPKHNSRDVVVGHLEQELASISESQGHKSHLENLIKELRSTANLGSGTISELLKRHNGPVSRALLLFFLRENADDLFEFFRNKLIKDDEIICAAILFGARARWLALPLSLRTPKELATYVIQRMAAVEQGFGGLSFGPLPTRPQPLRELFQSKTHQWNKEQEAVALDISRTQKWTECLKTEISLQPGQYQLEVDKNEVRILLQGDSPTTTTRVIPENLLRRIGSWPPLGEKIESIIRAKLKVEY